MAESAGLRDLADEHLTVPTDKGANAGLKVASLVAGMSVGADSIDDMAVLRHGGMGRVFTHAYAPSTLGSFLRSLAFGHVRQLDAVASRFLTRLAAVSPVTAGVGDLAILHPAAATADRGTPSGTPGQRGPADGPAPRPSTPRRPSPPQPTTTIGWIRV